MEKRRLLITGGAGFIGVNAARHFLGKGWDVTLLDNFSRKGTDINVKNLHREFPDVPVIRADICTDQKQLDNAVAKSDAVLHLAAQVAVTTSITDPRNDMRQNILGTFNVLEAIRASENQPPLIYSSTNKVYGALEEYAVREATSRFEFVDDTYRSFGVPEKQTLDFHSPYGCSKGAADQYVIDYGRIYGLRTLSLRQSCIYGQHQFGVEDQGWIAWFTIAAMRGKPLTIYGSGFQVRDGLFVDDLSRLYELAFEKIDTLPQRAYNVGGGAGNTISLLELLELLKKKYGYNPDVAHSDIRAGDQPIFVADIRALAKDLNWKPEMGIKDGIGKMHEWLHDNREVIAGVLG